MAISPFFVMSFMALTAFIYAIDVDIYTFRLAFSSKTHCI